MGSVRVLCAICALLLAVCFLASCKTEPEQTSSAGSASEPSSPETSASEQPETGDASDVSGDLESEDEVSLPPPEAIVLLYTDYLTVRTEQDGLEYEYTYCFDANQEVFNAVAVLRFPTEEAAQREYNWLRINRYPNLELDGASLSFCFPKMECPCYGISYRALEVLLEETVYEIIDRRPPETSEGPTESEES